MHFPMPNFPCEFELPDEWLMEAGMVGSRPTGSAYASDHSAILVPLREIEPPFRNLEVPKDWHGFDRVRMVRVLRGIVSGAEIPPVPLRELPEEVFPDLRPYRYRVRDGIHRFYASIAAEFQKLPAVIG
jgi:hypothetical protein